MEAGMPGMMSDMMPQQGANEEENNNNKVENDIKPLEVPVWRCDCVRSVLICCVFTIFSI